jgi:hypothetical protein
MATDGAAADDDDDDDSGGVLGRKKSDIWQHFKEVPARPQWNQDGQVPLLRQRPLRDQPQQHLGGGTSDTSALRGSPD